MGFLKHLKPRSHKSSEFTKRADASKTGTTAPAGTSSVPKDNGLAYQVEEVHNELTDDHVHGDMDHSLLAVTKDDVAVEAVPDSPPPPQAPEDADISQSAYYIAWASLDEPTRAKLGSDKDMKQLFQQLNEADDAHYEKSRFARGLKVVGPYLEQTGSVMELTGTLASLHPIASTAHGIIKSSVTILTTLCGAGEELSGQIETFVLQIPAIERVNQVVKNGTELPDIHKTLVAVYNDLFDFIVNADAALTKEKFVSAAITLLRRKTPGILSSFNKHAEILSKLLQAEMAATLLEIKAEINDVSLGSNLDVEERNWTALQRGLKEREDGACDWISRHEDFCTWADTASSQNILVLLGDMGCGKTMTTAFVADKCVPRNHVVCAHYITRGTPTAELPTMLRSLMWQLLQAQPKMKRDFMQWFRESTNPSNSFRQVSYDDKIIEFLRRALTASNEPVYIVIDALDECDISTLTDLMAFFAGILDSGALLKVFFSMQHNDEVTGLLPPGTATMECQTSPAQSRALAAFLAKRANIQADIRDRLVEQVVTRAEGSAIWISIALEYMKRRKLRNNAALDEAMREISNFKGLTEMYWKLFEKCKNGLDENEELLSVALDTLAVARRPLTVEELAYAVFIEADRDNGYETIEKLDEAAHGFGVFDIVQPFVRKLQVDDGRDQLRLIHNSLRDLILRGPPSEWMTLTETRPKRNQKISSRETELEGHLLQRCVNYLLYDECATNRLPFLDDDGFFFELGDPFHDSDEEDNFAKLDSDEPLKFNPKDLGFGGFYTYAASSWLYHYGRTTADLEPSAHELIALCAKDAPRTMNWIEQWRRPNCSYQAEVGFFLLEARTHQGKFDPLAVATVFGSARSMAAVLKGPLPQPVFYSDTLSLCISNLVRFREPSVLEALLADPELTNILDTTDFLWELSYGYYQQDLADEWSPVIDILISRNRNFLLEYGNAILCGAARHRALPLLKRLFAAADNDADLRAALLITDIKRGSRYQAPLHAHQSVGEAARSLRADIVRFLCEQDGIAPHLHYRDADGNTAFHIAVKQSWYQTADVLLEFWPQGLLQENNAGEDPLTTNIYSTLQDAPRLLQFLRLVLANEVVRKVMREKTGRQVSTVVIQALAKWRHVALCCALIREGEAAVGDVVELDAETGRPALREGSGKNEQVLAQLCYLLPLSIRTEFLFMKET